MPFLLVALVIAGCAKGTDAPAPDAPVPTKGGAAQWYYGTAQRCFDDVGCRLYVARFDAQGVLDRRYGARPDKYTYPGTLYARIDIENSNQADRNTYRTTEVLPVSGGRVVAVGALPHGMRALRWTDGGKLDEEFGVRGLGWGPMRDPRFMMYRDMLVDVVALPDDSVIGVSIAGFEPRTLAPIVMVRIGPDGRLMRAFGEGGVATVTKPEIDVRGGRASTWRDGVRFVTSIRNDATLWLVDLRSDGKVVHNRPLRIGGGSAVVVEEIGTNENGDSVAVLRHDDPDGGRSIVRIDRYGNLDGSFAKVRAADLVAGEVILDRVSVLHADTATFVATRTCVSSKVRVSVARLDEDGRPDRSWGTAGRVFRDIDAACDSGEGRAIGSYTTLGMHRIEEKVLLVGQFELDGAPAAMIATGSGLTQP